jgi:hypothetical protein
MIDEIMSRFEGDLDLVPIVTLTLAARRKSFAPAGRHRLVNLATGKIQDISILVPMFADRPKSTEI